jgi:hypothetical protein
MPKREDVSKVMIIGSGPIIIGQSCEFDYSGTQACKALRSLGYEIVLANSNTATIMTDPGMADVTYIEPLNLRTMEKIIAAERDKPGGIEAARQFSVQGFKILATKGTSRFPRQQGVKTIEIFKLRQGRPNIIDAIKNSEIQLIINTPKGKSSHDNDDSYIRQAAISYKIPFITTPSAALAAAKGIAARKKGEALVKSLQSYHKELG